MQVSIWTTIPNARHVLEDGNIIIWYSANMQADMRGCNTIHKTTIFEVRTQHVIDRVLLNDTTGVGGRLERVGKYECCRRLYFKKMVMVAGRIDRFRCRCWYKCGIHRSFEAGRKQTFIMSSRTIDIKDIATTTWLAAFDLSSRPKWQFGDGHCD